MWIEVSRPSSNSRLVIVDAVELLMWEVVGNGSSSGSGSSSDPN